MAKVKKINPEWQPSERKSDGTMWEVGDLVEVTDYRQLVRSGAAVLIDDQGNEIGLPGERYKCAVCTKELDELMTFVAHVKGHERTVITVPVAPTVSSEVAVNVAATLAQASQQTIAEIENTRGSAEPNAVAPTEEILTPQQRADEIKAKRLAALARAREVRAAKIAGE